MSHRKPHLPEKTCAACGRPFARQRKWAQVWEDVSLLLGVLPPLAARRGTTRRERPLLGRLLAVTLAVGLVLAAPASSDEAAAEAALDRMIESQSAVLDTLETIEDAAGLERERDTLLAELARARRDLDAVAGHADAFGGSETLRAALVERMRAYTARRDAVYGGVIDRLDEDALDRLDEIFDEAD